MKTLGHSVDVVPLVLAQGAGPTYGHREAYEGGSKVGQITAYVMVGAVVIWGLLKLFKKRS